MTDVKMPQMGESIAEGTISVWLIDEGQTVKADEPLVTVSTDKADVDIPSPVSGVLSEIIAKEGATVKVGELIARIDEKVAVVGENLQKSASEEAKKPVSEPEMAVKKDGPAEHPVRPEGIPAAEARRETRPEEEVTPPPEIERKAEEREKIPQSIDKSAFYSPAVMRLAMAHGIDLKTVTGTGEGGRIAKADVMRALGEAGRPAQPAPSPRIVQEELLEMAKPAPGWGLGAYKPPVYEVEEGDTELPFSRLRKIIADHMVYSKRTSAHVTTVTEVDFEHIVVIREHSKVKIKTEVGISITYMPFVMAAAVRALKEFPLINSVVQGDVILTKHHVNLGVAMDSERGLMVPVIRGAEDKSLLELAKAVSELSIKVRDRKVAPDEMAGGTFTVTNPGRHGNLFGTPIISQPQVGILRMGELIKRAVVVTAEDGEDAIAIRPMMYLALSYDHRVVDGVTANEFLHRIKEHLEVGDFEL
ncbi:MAG: dihydrolipoamide acetyltransferase family protein [Nitrospirota bacterium]